jgi:hypothetical protein
MIKKEKKQKMCVLSKKLFLGFDHSLVMQLKVNCSHYLEKGVVFFTEHPF